LREPPPAGILAAEIAAKARFLRSPFARLSTGGRAGERATVREAMLLARSPG
jgi:hypothetical protein